MTDQHSVVNSLPAQNTAASNDARRHARHEFGQVASVYEMDEYGSVGEGRECEAVDLSRSGVGLRSRRMLHSGRAVLILIPKPGGGNRALYGIVRYSRYQNRGMYHIGVQFEPRPQSSEVQRWLREHEAE